MDDKEYNDGSCASDEEGCYDPLAELGIEGEYEESTTLLASDLGAGGVSVFAALGMGLTWIAYFSGVIEKPLLDASTLGLSTDFNVPMFLAVLFGMLELSAIIFHDVFDAFENDSYRLLKQMAYSLVIGVFAAIGTAGVLVFPSFAVVFGWKGVAAILALSALTSLIALPVCAYFEGTATKVLSVMVAVMFVFAMWGWQVAQGGDVMIAPAAATASSCTSNDDWDRLSVYDRARSIERTMLDHAETSMPSVRVIVSSRPVATYRNGVLHLSTALLADRGHAEWAALGALAADSGSTGYGCQRTL